MYATIITDEGAFEGEVMELLFTGSIVTVLFNNGDVVATNITAISYLRIDKG